jgi:mannose-1-phosphate guanylyltransferase
LSGGSGKRLWPLSRSGFPKQFLNLTGDLSLFQLTAKRIEGLASNTFKVNPLIIISGEDHRFIVKAQLASKIGEIITSRKWSQQKAADMLGIPQSKLSKILRGQFRGISESYLKDKL